jgi:sigma-B regulation protein RsbU (phosphoserine phosphatase)
MGHGISGQVAQTGEIINIGEVHQNPNFYDKVDQKTGHTTKSYLCAPLKLRGEIIGTTQLMNKNGGAPFTDSDERFMDFFTNQAALAIETARLLQDSLEKKSLEKELQLAHDIQAGILPQSRPILPGFHIIGSSAPARTVGGDYFNYFPFAAGEDKPGLLVVIADVSGKGIPASLIVSKLDGALQLLLPLYHDLEQLMTYLNNFLYKDLLQGSFLSLFIAHLQSDHNHLRYINCGHNPPFLFDPSRPQKVHELERSGPILGIQSDIHYPQYEIPFAPNKLLALFSDGIVEAQNPQQALYGEARLQQTISAFLQNTPDWSDLSQFKELERQIWHNIHSFKQGASINDDATLLLVSRLKQKKE